MRWWWFGLSLIVACGGSADADDTAGGGSAITGGQAESNWAASGYLLAGPSMDALDKTRPACGATLIAPNVVVTAARCVVDDKRTFAFGVGDLGGGAVEPPVRVVDRTIHPDFHAEADGALDVDHILRKFDVAWLILERSVAGVTPATLPATAPVDGCTVEALGYHDGRRVSTDACIELQVELGTDPIFEVHPDKSSALCMADGDEGSAVVARDAGTTTLVGIFAGSVTEPLTDCVNGAQFLDGYESIFGYTDFLRQGILAGAKKRS